MGLRLAKSTETQGVESYTVMMKDFSLKSLIIHITAIQGRCELIKNPISCFA
jgi:hypothetical protein